MTYKTALLDVLQTYLRTKMTYKEIEQAYGNWNQRESKADREKFINETVLDVHQLINAAYDLHTGNVSILEAKEKFRKLFTIKE